MCLRRSSADISLGFFAGAGLFDEDCVFGCSYAGILGIAPEVTLFVCWDDCLTASVSCPAPLLV